MKKLFVIICALFVGFAYGANENVPTSKKFVDDALAQKQPKFDGLGNNKLMLYSDTTDGVVASRDIVTTLGNSTSANTVPTVGAINAGLATKQDILNGDAGWVAENTGVAGAVVQKPVYSATNNYSNALIEVETLNNAVINAVNSELTVVPGVGWTINTANNLNLLSVPKTYNPYLPDGYTQVEYIESTGAQYIRTGTPIYKTANAELTMRAQFAPSEGCSWMGANAYMQLCIGQVYTTLADGHANPAIAVGNIDDIVMQYNDYILKLYINGQNVSGVSWQSYSASQTFMDIFALGTTTATSAMSIPKVIGKIYNYRLKIDNQLVRNFIPARRDSDGEVGMYDTVSNTFFTNDGTGEFIAGPDVRF